MSQSHRARRHRRRRAWGDGEETPRSLLDAPRITPRITLRPAQAFGLPLLLLLPVLAAAGVFGDRPEDARASGAGVEMRIRYPDRVRYSTAHVLEVSVTNVSAAPLADARVELDRGYLSAFSEIELVPEITGVTAAAFEVALPALAPGETRRVTAWLRADRYGRHRGAVTVAFHDRPAARVPVSTIVFP